MNRRKHHNYYPIQNSNNGDNYCHHALASHHNRLEYPALYRYKLTHLIVPNNCQTANLQFLVLHYVLYKNSKQNVESVSSKNLIKPLQLSKDKYSPVYCECYPVRDYTYYKYVLSMLLGIHHQYDKEVYTHKNSQKRSLSPMVVRAKP